LSIYKIRLKRRRIGRDVIQGMCIFL